MCRRYERTASLPYIISRSIDSFVCCDIDGNGTLPVWRYRKCICGSDPETLLGVPVTISKSDWLKPVTDSLNVTVKGIGDVLVEAMRSY